MTRPFRFGVVAPLQTDLPAWRDHVRRIADSGYSTLLMPDVPQWQPAPGPTLATAAALTGLRVGTWVYAAPLRPPWMMAWEAHSLSVLTEGRFEMGIGTGRPGIEDELRERGLPVVSPGERLTQVREAIKTLRDLDGADLHTPVVMAVRGPKSQALAAEVADIVTFVLPPNEAGASATELARGFRASRDVELALHVAVVGNTRAAFMASPDIDPAAAHAVNSLAALPADPKAAAEEIQRRPPPPPRREARDELKPATASRIAASRPQPRHPRPAPVGDLHPDNAVPGPDRDRDRLPGSTRAAMPDTVTEDLADQQDGHISARVPRAEYLSDERAGGPRPLRPPGKRHALPDRRPSHHRTRPSPAARPGETGRAAGGRREMHA